MRVSPVLTAPFFCLFLAACSSTPEPETEIISQFKGQLPLIVENDSGLLHGISLGMTPEEVKKNALEEDSLGIDDPAGMTLLFERRLTADRKKEYTYECKFDNKGLYELTLEIHLKDQPDADSLYMDFANYYSKRYGMAQTPEGRTMWVTDEGKRPAKIILEDNTAEYNYGKLTIVFFDRSFDPPPSASDSLLLIDTLLLP